MHIRAMPSVISGNTAAQNQALALREPRDFWDPNYVSEDGSINQQYATSTQPLKTIAFRIPRLRALVNAAFKDVYATPLFPNVHTDPVPLSLTEWNVAAAGESDFSTALADADVFGILGRERMFSASRWTAADSTAPAYQALKLFRNYDGAHHTFAPISVSATNDGDPSLFSSYAAIDAAGTTVTVLAINKSPSVTATTTLNLGHFTASSAKTYTLSQASPTTIVAGTSGPLSTTYSFAPYSATLLVITGSIVQPPAVEWDLNPDTIMVPAGGNVTLSPKIISGSGTVTLNSQTSDSGISVALTQPSITTTPGTVTVTAGATPGFYHYTVTGTDNGGSQQTQGGWIVVGNPGSNANEESRRRSNGFFADPNRHTQRRKLRCDTSGCDHPVHNNRGGTLSTTSSSVSPPTLCNTAGTSCMASTDSSGNATVTLTLPNGTGQVTVTAEAP